MSRGSCPDKQCVRCTCSIDEFSFSPFCCKVRAYLNYNRIPYDIVEVNSVMRSETKWSIYKKVPIVVIENEQIQLNDSSLIISTIESYLRMPTKQLRNVSTLYQPVIEKDDKGKLSFNYPNKYFLVEPLAADRVDPEKRVSTEKNKNDADERRIALPVDRPSSNSLLGISSRVRVTNNVVRRLSRNNIRTMAKNERTSTNDRQTVDEHRLQQVE
jgi:hypothetical protein